MVEYTAMIDGLLRQIRNSRNFNRLIVHVDMDMFFAACEELRNPALASIPFAVGSKMMLSTTNYLARKFGIRAGQPGFIGIALAKELGNVELKIVPTNYQFYQQISGQVQNILRY